MDKYQKIITVIELEKETICSSINMLMDFMFKKTPYPQYFQLRLKDSEKCPFAKDLLLEWCDNTKEEK